MLDEEVAKAIANGRGIGLADMMYKQMEKDV
ncbi:MAG: rod-binding protein [Defluviitaleaceae bacterium]|nr:rod-binding protein [Defluviitaleaceae bacterium]